YTVPVTRNATYRQAHEPTPTGWQRQQRPALPGLAAGSRVAHAPRRPDRALPRTGATPAEGAGVRLPQRHAPRPGCRCDAPAYPGVRTTDEYRERAEPAPVAIARRLGLAVATADGRAGFRPGASLSRHDRDLAEVRYEV